MYLRQASARLLDLVAGRCCAACGTSGDLLCPGCVELALALPAPPILRPGGLAVRAALPFQHPVRPLVHAAKFGGVRRAAHLLGALAAERLAVAGVAPPDLVVPVPLGRRRRRLRGFNQAEVVARALRPVTAAPVEPGLRRLRETAPQVGRSARERRGNVAGAFGWRGAPLEGASLWLVDDVVTTGATMAAAAAALQRAGAGRIECVAASMAPPYTG